MTVASGPEAVSTASHGFSPDPRVGPIRPAIGRPVLMAVIGLAFLAHLHILLYRNINWDEFWFLSFVYDYARGSLVVPLQSFHVHFFGWLPATGGQEVDQIIVARAAFLVLFLGTCACVYRLARRMASADASWFAVVCFAGYTNVLYHGTSFRADGLSVFLLMLALVLTQSRGLRLLAVAVSALLVAVSLLVTLKSVFFLPTIGVLLVVAGSSRDARIGRIVQEALLFVAVLVGATLGLYLWHVRTLGGPTAYESVAAFLQTSANKAVRPDPSISRFFAFRETVRGNLIQWGVLVYAIGLIARKLVLREQIAETFWMLAFLLPLISLVFYRNVLPYFFVFIMPPALVLCAVTFDEWARRAWAGPLHDGHLTVLATLAIGFAVAWGGLRPAPDGTKVQREVIGAVHDIFPHPVPYIDRNGMIASFPKVGFFMSSWALDDYRDARTPVFRNLLRTYQPKLLVDNSPVLAAALGGKGTPVLFEEDAAVLRESFVPYWGSIYVAGTLVHLDPGTDATWEVLVAGSYRLKSQGPVTIRGSQYSPGSSVDLPIGRAILRSDTTQDIVLRTNDAGDVPTYPPPTGPIYTGFGLSAPLIRFPS